MVAKTMLIGGRRFRLIPESELRALRKQAKVGLEAQRQTGRKVVKSRWEGKSLKEMNEWMSAHWDEIMEKAKANTKKLTGREVI